ncbi:MAG: hypothetical protein R3F62_20030 [Planctomycetota bacterium]
MGGLASCALGAALFQANSALAAYALTFALTVLIQVLVWPAVRWDRWRAMTHDVRRVLRDDPRALPTLGSSVPQGGVLADLPGRPPLTWATRWTCPRRRRRART